MPSLASSLPFMPFAVSFDERKDLGLDMALFLLLWQTSLPCADDEDNLVLCTAALSHFDCHVWTSSASRTDCFPWHQVGTVIHLITMNIQ